MKKLLTLILQWTFRTCLQLPICAKIADVFLKVCLSRKMSVMHEGTELWFSIPNLLNKSRAATFSSKEPETLRWIDSIGEGSVFWDIGANVGLYSCYAAKARNCRVFAFEPSVFNHEALARNVNLNCVSEIVTIVPLPLCERKTIQNLNMTSTEWGGALSTFGEEFGHDGNKLDAVFSFKTLGLSMDDMVDFFLIPTPNYIKIDVDGIEHLILSGGAKVLANTKSILIEINDDFHQQSEESSRCLNQAGFHLVEKCHSEMVEQSPFSKSYNQIWSK